MNKIVRIKAKQKPKDNSIELSFVADDTDLSRYSVLSNIFYLTPETAIISYIKKTYKNTKIYDIDRYHYGTSKKDLPHPYGHPILHIYVSNTSEAEDITNTPIAIYTVTTTESSIKYDEGCYYINNYDNYSIKRKIGTLAELASEYDIIIYILNEFVSDDTNHCDKSDNNINTDKDYVRNCFDPFNNASTDKNLAHITNEFKETKYTSLSTGYSDDIASIKGHIYDTIQCRYISNILNAALRALMIPSDKIYFLNMESIKLKNTETETKDIVKAIKAFIESQSIFMSPGSVFIPFYIDNGTEISKNLIKILIEAGFQGIWSLYMYTDDPNSNKVFEELLKMENNK